MDVKIGDIVLYLDKVSNCCIPAIITKIIDSDTVSLISFPEEGHPKNWISAKKGGNVGEWRVQ